MKSALDQMGIKLDRETQELQEAMQRIREQDDKLSSAQNQVR